MARKSVGYVNLFWKCPNCGTQNPGPQKTCSSCGSPQPENVVFVQGKQQDLIKDEEEIKKIKKGADIHCPFCGARNPADTKICTQCGGDIVEGTRRASGTVVGAYKAPSESISEIACPSCGSSNPETAEKCAQCGALLKPAPEEVVSAVSSDPPAVKRKFNVTWLIIGAVILCVCAIGSFIVLSTLKTKSSSGTVDSVHWMRSISIEEMQEVTKSDWEEDIPADGTILSCELEYHHTQNEPAANATEVCGTEYVEDTGTGHGEVVQDCEYSVYQKMCDYRIKEYVVVDEISAQGNDLNPYWPQPNLSIGQVEGEESEHYTIIFESEGKMLEYQTSDAQLFSRCTPGSNWTLNINTFGDIVSITSE